MEPRNPRRNLERIGDVPTGLVHDHDDELVRMTFSYRPKEQGHHFRVHPGQDQAVHNTVMRAHSGESIGVLAKLALPNYGTNALGSPTPAGIPEQTETSLILEHQPDRETFC